MRKVEVVPHQKEWIALYHSEARKLKQVFGDEMVESYHIGSTAIESIYAKPVIDILIEAKNIERIDLYDYEMEQLGYVAKGENGIAGRRFFMKGGDDRTHHLHVFESENPEIQRHLLFRDFMNAHPEEAKKYSDLKRELAREFPKEIDEYIAGKHDFIQNIDEKAQSWINRNTE
ncbi:hypothetical protein CR194_07430 [Salipaludibacillus keqinensis]|uniref:GrpB family protein n=1 Tax=Salipaludibacillus keqinensis TaxID=2045207 RepID=A0A323TCI4_9BACI|nr:GrpB family protein [Salipaludibacillus keqinensis]PYZ93022.1 hypothetical protein CR194_07430 [Salipaludibacillus keqinensis]